MIDLGFLEKVTAFKSLTDGQLREIRGCSHLEEFNRGERLFAEGETATHLWIVKNGEVALRTEKPDGNDDPRGAISFISKAHTFGWSCFAPPYRYRLSGYCESRVCEVIKIEKEKLISLFDADPVFGHKVMTYLLDVVGTHFHQYQDEIAKVRGESILHQW